MPEFDFVSGSDCTKLFRRAYENRYTWDEKFRGYSGSCLYQKGSSVYEGKFLISNDLKPQVIDIKDEAIEKLISSQLWEVAIHRVRRDFESIHSENTFTSGDVNDIGLEVLVGGKNQGDRYRIKDDVVTMVHRHIHGSLINIFTQKIKDTGSGYLSSTYTSQYFDPVSRKPKSKKLLYKDDFALLDNQCQWVLKSRLIEKCDSEGLESEFEKFIFSDLTSINI